MRTTYTTRQLIRELRAARRQLVELEQLTAERARAEAALRRRAEELGTLNTLGRRVSASLSPEQVVEAALEVINHSVAPDWAMLFLLQGDTLVLDGLYPDDPIIREGAPKVQRVGECLCGLAAEIGEAVYSADITSDARCTLEECKQAGVRSFAALPLRQRAEVLGVLGLVSDTERDFTAEAAFLEALTAEIAIALQNALLYHQLQLRAAELEGEVRERERAEEALRQSRERYRSLVETSPDAITVTDLEGQVVLCNQKAAELRGVERVEEMVGTSIFDFVAPEESRIAVAAARVALENGGVRDVHLTALKAGGAQFPVELSVSLTADPDGAPDGFIAVVRDITERVQAEADREALIAELEAKNAELERFTYTVSHDLKSPLITIKGFLSFLEQDVANGKLEPARDDIARITEGADRMEQLLDELLELSRIGRILNAPEEVLFGELAQEAAHTVAGRLTERKAQLEIAPELLGPNGPKVYGDRLRLREVLENLVDNAVKFMGDQPLPRVEIGARRAGEETVYYVGDNGMGIETRYQEKVFGLFEKLDAQSEGTGVGLAIVKRIVELHGGEIWIESEGAGQGSRFCFTLPDGEGVSRA